MVFLEENETQSIPAKISAFIAASRRIFTVSKKPDADEYRQMAKIIGIGIILIGIIGFIVIFIFLLTGLGK